MEKIHYIQEIMQRQGVSIGQLAERLGVAKSSAASHLTHDLRVSKAKKIADALGVSLAALFVEPTQYTQSAPEESSHLSTTCPHCKKTLDISINPK